MSKRIGNDEDMGLELFLYRAGAVFAVILMAGCIWRGLSASSNEANDAMWWLIYAMISAAMGLGLFGKAAKIARGK